ncbi:hypothetical protein [Hoyosella altamirensis]|uniref:Uncharacterized protein n=1 Tax=Hoyosella altamirensis TaxID=616997 RepID=A0A839RMC8_9ACTN|nr:hypothetical protein [Hoyosella altamirensis]MBB3037895.1 hypothetical protein [Hoyosella altamirensis]
MATFLYRLGRFAFRRRWPIVPAALALLGERAWWMPRWLDRIPQNVDVEGEQLRYQLDRSDQRQQPEEAPVAL